jgi:segregation and condensation protein B
VENLPAIIEALLYVVDEPLKRERLYSLLPDAEGIAIEEAIEIVRHRFASQDSGLMVREVAGGIQLVTRPEFDPLIREYLSVKRRSQLSRQALETLAIIAYEQPISTPEIKELRGTDPSGVISTLLQRRLIRIAGRKEVIGRPFMYATTDEFLLHFGLRSLDDLPKPEDFDTLLEEADAAARSGAYTGTDAIEPDTAGEAGIIPARD